MAGSSIRIGGASGYWGDAALATPQLLAADPDFIVYDYLAEVTMSIMARARAADPGKGYATDFVSVAIGANIDAIAGKGVKIVANAGGVNPAACAAALRELIAARDLQLRVAVVLGDDLLSRREEFTEAREMFTGESFPAIDAVASVNAYLGAFPIAAALNAGADIVVTGRCVDSAVTLGAAIHAFGWTPDDFDLLAQGSLAGHILECGTQATGGNFTDWERLGDGLADAGYPIAEIQADGDFVVTKPAGTGGEVSVGTVAEQMLYEIGDPCAYQLPDVVCDFSGVKLEALAEDCVRVTGARGHGAPTDYKVCATWADGFRAGQLWSMIGRDAEAKARLFAQSVFKRSNQILRQNGLTELAETSVEILGAESHYGARAADLGSREVDVKIAAKHPSPKGVAVFLKEMIGLALTAPPGLAGFAGARPKPMPVVRLFSFLLPKEALSVSLELDGEPLEWHGDAPAEIFDGGMPASAGVPVPPADDDGDRVEVPLEALAYGRSGDKGDKANIGIIARREAFLPWIAATLTEERVAACFAHFLEPEQRHPVERFYLPGTHALNFLLHRVLGGGGVASLRADPQGKSYAQLLLCEPIAVPRELAAAYQLPLSHESIRLSNVNTGT